MNRLNINIEKLPVVDASGKVVGGMSRQEAHGGSKKLHPVVHLHIIERGAIYLQKRSDDKDIQPGKWDTAVGGHVDYGEDVEQALKREAFEELSVVGFKPNFIVKYIWESEEECELVFSFFTRYDGEIVPNVDEISEGRYWKFQEVVDNLGKGIFTPNFEKEYRFLSKTIIPVLKEHDK